MQISGANQWCKSVVQISGAHKWCKSVGQMRSFILTAFTSVLEPDTEFPRADFGPRRNGFVVSTLFLAPDSRLSFPNSRLVSAATGAYRCLSRLPIPQPHTATSTHPILQKSKYVRLKYVQGYSSSGSKIGQPIGTASARSGVSTLRYAGWGIWSTPTLHRRVSAFCAKA